MPTAIATIELLVWEGKVIKAEASWITTTWMKTVKTLTKYVLKAISAKSENLGKHHSKKINGDNTAPREIKISLLMYINNKTIETIKNNKRKIKVTKGVVLVREVTGLIASESKAWLNPPVE